MMRVGNKPGRMIPKPSVGLFRPKPQRYYNYAVDADGQPYAAEMDREVPRDEYHMRMVIKGDMHLIDEKPKEAPKKAVRKLKTESEK